MLLNGQIMDEWDARGRHVRDDVLLILLNAYHEPIGFRLPGLPTATPWEVLVDTATSTTEEYILQPGMVFALQGRSLVLLRQRVAALVGETA